MFHRGIYNRDGLGLTVAPAVCCPHDHMTSLQEEKMKQYVNQQPISKTKRTTQLCLILPGMFISKLLHGQAQAWLEIDHYESPHTKTT